MKSLGAQVAKGAAWMVALKLAMKLIGLLSTIILARLLKPEDFGLIAIIMAIFAMIEILGNFSFDTVLIQKANASADDYNTAWSFNVAFGVFACIVLTLGAGWVADFYGDVRIQPVMIALSGLFLLSGFQNIGVVEFRKNLTFDKEFRYQIFPKLLSFFSTMGFAFWLQSYWALVFGSLVWRLFVLVAGYALHSFRPRFTFSEWRHLFQFSKWLMINNFLYFFNNRSPEMIIGKLFSPQAAGFFTIAQEISTLPTSEFAANITAASYPGYCKISSYPEKLREMYLSVLESIVFFVMPAGIGIAMLANVLVPVVLGEQWSSSIGLIQYLALSGALIAMTSNTGSVFLALGRPKVPTLMSFIRMIVLIPLIFWCSSNVGLIGVAQAVFLSSLLVFVSSMGLLLLGLKINLMSIIRVFTRPVLGSIVMALVLDLVANFLQQNNVADVIQLFMLILVGLFVYTFCVFVVWMLCGRASGPESNILALFRGFKFTGSAK